MYTQQLESHSGETTGLSSHVSELLFPMQKQLTRSIKFNSGPSADHQTRSCASLEKKHVHAHALASQRSLSGSPSPSPFPSPRLTLTNILIRTLTETITSALTHPHHRPHSDSHSKTLSLTLTRTLNLTVSKRILEDLRDTFQALPHLDLSLVLSLLPYVQPLLSSVPSAPLRFQSMLSYEILRRIESIHPVLL